MPASTTVLDLVTGLDNIFWTKGRLDTYKEWPFKPENGTCTSERMAAAGFFVVGGQDEDICVECFICMKQLDGWEPNDDPWQEHRKHKPDCLYVILNKQDEKLWTVDDLFTLIKAHIVNRNTRSMENIVQSIKAETQNRVEKIPKICRAQRLSRKGGK